MKKLFCLICVLALLASTAVFAETEITTKAQLDAMTKEELVALAMDLLGIEDVIEAPSAYTELKKGDKNDDVKLLQNRLRDLGYMSAKADGSYSKSTVAAVKAFQTQNGLEVTGVADAATQELLFSADCPAAIVYGDLAYNDVSRNPSNYTDKYVTFSGKVLQVIEVDDEIQFRVATKGKYDNVVYVYMIKPENYSRILENDKIIVYGQYQDLYTYTTVRGDSVTIPLIHASSITLK